MSRPTTALRRATEADILRHAKDYPEHGQSRAAAELARQGLTTSASTVRQVWVRHGLQTAYQRLKAVGASSSAPGFSTTQRELIRRGDQSRRMSRARSTASDEPADRRAVILEAAAQLFAERGYEGASLRDLAGRVGLLPGSIYHYHPSKEALFLAVTHEGFRQLMADVDAAIARERGPWEKLRAAFEAHIHAVVEGNTISKVTVASLFAVRDKKLAKHLKPDRDRYEKVYVELIDALGLPRRIDRKMLRFMIFGALNWTLVWYRDGGLAPAEIAARFVAILRGERD